MLKRITWLLAATLAARATLAADTNLQFYGMIRADAIYDDSRPDAAQTPTYIRSEGTDAQNVSDVTLHPRLSRLGLDLSGPLLEELADARLAGKLELDFQNGGRESRAASIPNFQGRIGLTYPLSGRKLALGAWGYKSRTRVDTPIAGRRQFDGYAAGIDFEVPVGTRVLIRGEAWTGTNLSDVRGGIGQSVNLKTGRTIDSRGRWAETAASLVKSYALSVGYTLDSPESADVAAGGRTRNDAWYLANRLNFGKVVTIGADWLRWTTQYQGLPEGTDDRVNVYMIYSF